MDWWNVRTDEIVPKQYLQVTWRKLEINDRLAFMVKHFASFDIGEIHGMFTQMPKEYHALKQRFKSWLQE